MLDKQLQAEHDLATAIGWTNLVDAGGPLIGTPPSGAEHSRGQAPVPAWSRDWRLTGPLLAALNLCVDTAFSDAGLVVVSFGFGLEEYIQVLASEWPSRDEAVQYAITLAARTKVVRAATAFRNDHQESPT